jgi:nitrate reductase delta subunit
VTYSLWASLFAYPDPSYPAAVERCTEAAHSENLTTFATAVSALTVEQLQEQYTQSFDRNPDTTLDIGWHVFGENYDRGDFLVKLRDALRRHGVPENGELPDHLSHVLRLLDVMPADERKAFAVEFVAPALEKIRAGVAKSESMFVPLVLALIEQVAGIAAQPQRSGAIQ